jgi:hypothetical protein
MVVALECKGFLQWLGISDYYFRKTIDDYLRYVP